MKIARSFDCGFGVFKIHKPRAGGRNSGSDFFSHPCGARRVGWLLSEVKTAGYFRLSLGGRKQPPLSAALVSNVAPPWNWLGKIFAGWFSGRNAK